MLKNFLKITFRQWSIYKTDSFVKFTSLLVGVTGCLLIAFFVQHEWRYDTFHKNAQHIYRINQQSAPENEQEFASTLTPRPLANLIQQRLPGIKQTVRLHKKNIVIQHNNQFFEDKVIFADPNFFSMFSFSLQSGNPEKVITVPHQVVITVEAAHKYFGHLDVMGKLLHIKIDTTFFDFTIAGIAETPPTYTTIPFTIIASQYWMESYNSDFLNSNWYYNPELTYVELEPKVERQQLETQLNDTVLPKVLTAGSNSVYLMQPITEVYYGRSLFGELIPPIDTRYLYIALSAGILLLIVGCINYTTLTLGRSVRRAKEVGVRKTMGASRTHLVKQFLSETFMSTLLTVILCCILVTLLIPYCSRFLHKPIEISPTDPYIIIIVAGVTLISGLVAGLYPAMFLSGFAPVQVLRGNTIVSNKNLFIRWMVAVQFIIAVILLMGTFAMHQQLSFLRNKTLGFDETQVIRLEVPILESKKIFRHYQSKVQSIPTVENMTAINQSMGFAGPGDSWQYPREVNGKEIQCSYLEVGPDFLESMKIDLLQGRDLPAFWEQDTIKQVLVNETFANILQDAPLGQRIVDPWDNHNEEIIGVVKDFHFLSLRQPIAPLIIIPYNYYSNFYVRVAANNLPQTIAQLEAAWNEIVHDKPFNFHFLDEDVEQQYLTEQRWTYLITTASVVVIFLTCIGLIGMTALITSQRTKEIGIRKVLGASISHILLLLSKDYIRLILVAFIIAIPVANYFITEWLKEFAYRIEVQWWMFAVPGVLVLLIALLSVTGQTWKAAHSNPVESLRNE